MYGCESTDVDGRNNGATCGDQNQKLMWLPQFVAVSAFRSCFQTTLTAGCGTVPHELGRMDHWLVGLEEERKKDDVRENHVSRRARANSRSVPCLAWSGLVYLL